MFSSNYNNVINPFAHLLPSSYLPPPPPMVSCDHQDSNDVHLHHYDLISATSLLPSNNPQLTESLINMALCNNAAAADGGGLQMEFFSGGNSSVPVKKPVKKDRHSKIQTAKGVRDRRVRLSIEIAREFFDLQDMLGFDKASKTLEWLLTKSRKAIKELVNMKHGGPRSSFDEDGDVDSSELEGTAPRSNSPDQGAVCKEIKMKRLHKAKVHLLAKESRAKARERTREKMCTATASPQFLNQLTLTQVEASNKPDQSYVHNMASSSCFKVVAAQQVEEPGCQNGFRESIMIKRRLKQSIVLGSDQQNIAVLKDGNNYFPNLSENWDANGAMPHSTFCAMTNVNFSTGDELYEKP